jgi:hypothetical protein
MMNQPIGLVSDTKFPIEEININTKTSRRMRSSDGELVRYVEDKHRHWVDYHSPARKRLYDVLEAFMDINGGMWPKKERDEITGSGRHAASINIAKQKMETLSGSLMSEKFDFDFKPLDIEENTLIESIKHWYFADKEQYNYSNADNQTNISGLLHAGVQTMYIDYNIRRTGAIGFKHLTDGMVLSDPYWQTNENKDWREAMIDGYLTPSKMIEDFNITDDGIRKLAEADFYIGETYEGQDDVRAWENLPNREGSRFLVSEYRWLEKLKTTRLHAQLPDGEWFAFPLKVREEQVRDFIEKMEIHWSDIREFPYEDNILQYCIISPDLTGIAPDLIFVRGKHPIQCGGIGLFKFSATRMFGIDKGLFEYILDLNRTLNYRQSKIDDIIASAASGMAFVNKNKIGGDAGIRQLAQNKTRPDYIHPVDGSPDGVATLFPINQVPEHIFREVNNIIDLFDRVSPVTPALEGAATKDESGILLEMRHEITKLGTLRLYNNWQQFLMDKAEAWYNQAQITYKNLYRKVPSANGAGSVEFNVPAFRTTAEGTREKVYINSIGDLPRAKVIVTLSKASPTKRMARRLELFDTTKMLSAHPELFKNEIRILTNDLISTIEREPEEQVKLERMQTLQEMRDILEIFTQIESLKAQGMEAQMMQKRLSDMMQSAQGAMQQITGQQQVPEQFEIAKKRMPFAQEQPAAPTGENGGMR